MHTTPNKSPPPCQSAAKKSVTLNIMNYLRWLLIIPAGFAGYIIALYLGMFSYIALESFCPDDNLINEMCNASYMNLVDKITFTFFPALAAILVVSLPTLVAPDNKYRVAVLAFVTGSLIAIYMGASIKAWVSLFATIIAGLISLFFIYRILKKHNKVLRA